MKHSFSSMTFNLQSCIHVRASVSRLPHRQTYHHAPIRLRAIHPEVPQNPLHPGTGLTVQHLSPVPESLAPSDDLLTVLSRQWVWIMRGLIRGLSSCRRWGERGSQWGGGSDAYPILYVCVELWERGVKWFPNRLYQISPERILLLK